MKNLNVELDITGYSLKNKEKIRDDTFYKIREFIEDQKDSVKLTKNPEYQTIKSNSDLSKYIGKDVKLICLITSFTDTEIYPYSYEDDNGDEVFKNVPVISIQLLHGNTVINTLVNCGRKKVDKIRALALSKERVIIKGRVLSFPTKKLTLSPSLYIREIEASKNCLELVEATEKEIIDTKKLIKKKKNLFQFIKKELLLITGIKSIEESHQLGLSLEFIILQALSDGNLGESTAKLHSLLIGAPASGKKLIAKAIEYLNPTFTETGAGKMTIAGLSASTKQKDGAWISTPGALVKSNQGVALCQDFHGVSKAILDQVMNIFSKVMEDGTVIDSASANFEHLAETSIHLDMNKVGHLKKVSGISYHEDIGEIPINILSRFDFVADIAPDNERQQVIALSMYENGQRICENEKQKKIRRLKLIIATLRDSRKDITLGGRERTLMMRLHEELFEFDGDLQDSPDLGAFQARTVNSIIKLSICLARASNRNKVSKKDVRLAFRFTQNKFSIIQKVISSFHANTSTLKGRDPSEPEIVKWILGKYSKQVVVPKDLMETMMAEFKLKKSQKLKRKVYRALKKCATSKMPQKGFFTVH